MTEFGGGRAAGEGARRDVGEALGCAVLVGAEAGGALRRLVAGLAELPVDHGQERLVAGRRCGALGLSDGWRVARRAAPRARSHHRPRAAGCGRDRCWGGLVGGGRGRSSVGALCWRRRGFIGGTEREEGGRGGQREGSDGTGDTVGPAGCGGLLRRCRRLGAGGCAGGGGCVGLGLLEAGEAGLRPGLVEGGGEGADGLVAGFGGAEHGAGEHLEDGERDDRAEFGQGGDGGVIAVGGELPPAAAKRRSHAEREELDGDDAEAEDERLLGDRDGGAARLLWREVGLCVCRVVFGAPGDAGGIGGQAEVADAELGLAACLDDHDLIGPEPPVCERAVGRRKFGSGGEGVAELQKEVAAPLDRNQLHILREPVLQRNAGARVRDHNIHAGHELRLEGAIDVVISQASERRSAGAEGGECLVGAVGSRMHNGQPQRAIGRCGVGLLRTPDLLEPLRGELLQQRVAAQRAPDGQLVVESGCVGGVRVVWLIRHAVSRQNASREDRRS